MELYIRIVDGQPFEHPILGDNFRQAFPHVDIDNLPPEFARFERIEQPTVEQYEVIDGVTYEWDNAIVKDVWHIRQMTDEERVAYDNEMLEAKIIATTLLQEQSNIGTTRV